MSTRKEQKNDVTTAEEIATRASQCVLDGLKQVDTTYDEVAELVYLQVKADIEAATGTGPGATTSSPGAPQQHGD